MDIITIKYFLSVARCMNFSQAAEENNISQSSFSKAIIRLERELGIRLIDRTRHPIILTEAGKAFYDRMCEMEPMYYAAMEEIQSYVTGENLHVLICPKSFIWKMAFEDYTKTNTNARIQYTETSDISQVLETMRSGKMDFAIAPRPFQNLGNEFRSVRIYDDELYLLVSDKSPFAKRDSISLSELDGQVFYETTYSRYLLEELTRHFRFVPGAAYPELGQEKRREETLHRISMNLGVGIYAGRDLAAYRSQHLRSLRILDVPTLPVVLLERTGERDTLARQHFRSWILANLESYMQERMEQDKFNHKVPRGGTG